MQIVFLDKETLGEEVSFDNIEKEGELIFYNNTKKEETIERIKNADIIITNKVYVGREEIKNSPKLKLICVAATGYNNIDVEAAKEYGKIVANVKNYSTESVAQTVFAYILSILNQIREYDRDVKNGEWSKSSIFTLLTHNIIELKNKKIGIIGYGDIGKRVEEIAKVFGMEVLIAKLKEKKYGLEEKRVEMEDLLRQSDIVTIHVPLNKDTENMITIKELRVMKREAILINTARGKIVNEDDLYEALKNKIIKAAALDVLGMEPPIEVSKLFELDNIIITPHVAWASKESRQRLIDKITENIRKFKEGKQSEINLY